MRGGGGKAGGLDPLENYKNIGFLSNTGSDPLKTTKLLIKGILLAFDDGPLIVVF